MFRYLVKIWKVQKMKLIDGKIISASVKERVRTEVEALKNEGITTGLAVTASVAAGAGIFFFVLAKRKKDDEEEEIE